jgi:hypothetical protein
VSRSAAFWLMGGLLGLLMFAAAAPSPLYAIYQADWHFSVATLTTVFAVYVVALLAAFLVTGGCRTISAVARSSWRRW